MATPLSGTETIITALKNPAGDSVLDSAEIVVLPNNVCTSVFIKEDVSNAPGPMDKKFTAPLSTIALSSKQVLDKLK